MTPLHHQIKSVLLPLCLEATAKLREVKDDKHEALQKAIAKLGNGITASYQQYICNMFALILERPEIKLVPTSGQNYELFTVIKIDNEFSLVVHGRNKYRVNAYGDMKEFSGSPPLASDEEIETYLDGLSAEQLRKLLVNEYIASIFVTLFEETSELVPADSLADDDVPF